MNWYQRRIQLSPMPRGFHLITAHVLKAIPEIRQLRAGVLHLFLQHTSASLSLNENADPDVPRDLEMSFNRLAPDSVPYAHDIEGPDDMPAHVKSALLGVSLTIPISDGDLAMGTWQGIYLCEHRNRGGSRHLVATVWGEARTA